LSGAGQRCYHERVKLPLSTSKFFLVLAAALSLTICAAGLPPANLPPVPNTVDSITPTELRMHLEFLASDELGGRYTLSPSFAIAARYLAAHLQAYGFHGAGDHGGFLQTFEVVSGKPNAADTALTLTIGDQTVNYGFGDFYPNSVSTANAQGAIVFAGSGISSPSQQHDDYAGLDVKGKIVLICTCTPAGIDGSRLAASEQGEAAARAHGAVGLLQIPTQRMADFLKSGSFRQRAAARETVRLAADADGKIPVLTLGPELAEKLLSLAGLNLKAVWEAASKKQNLESRVLPGTSARLAIYVQQTRTTTQNVAGILEGTDPQLKNEYVVFSAHYDHLQTGPNGEIYHGADDDGSGTTAVLAIARAMSMNRPKRSVLVIFHAGEELGLLGSEYNTDVAPVVPVDKMVVDLNIDMIGRSKPPGDDNMLDEHLSDANTVYLVGSNRISQELHQISEETNAQFQRLKLDYYYNDPNNPERIFYRSDHWNYAKHGVPIIFYFDGIHADYHKPTDTVDKIDFTKMTQITRLVFETGWRIANLDHRLAKAN
jgi:Peptidase family M28